MSIVDGIFRKALEERICLDGYELWVIDRIYTDQMMALSYQILFVNKQKIKESNDRKMYSFKEGL